VPAADSGAQSSLREGSLGVERLWLYAKGRVDRQSSQHDDAAGSGKDERDAA
jgi:hypothetical protein